MLKIMIYGVIVFWLYEKLQVLSIGDLKILLESYLLNSVESLKKILGA